MSKPIVSVVVPVYNVELYLARCIESILEQTLKEIQIILVDDGAKDSSSQICDEYAEKDSRIQVIHKENGGLASARNAGIKVAEGKYLLFVDSDDWIDKDTIQQLTDIAEREDVDFVRFRPVYANWPNHEDGTLCDFGTEKILHEGKYFKEDIIRDIYPILFATPELTLGPIVAAWRSLYRKSFIDENSLLFDEEVRYSEDAIFSAKVVMASNSFYYLDGGRYYHYFYNPSSITKSFRADRWDSCKNLMNCFNQYFLNHKDYDFTNQLWLQKLYCVVSALSQRQFIADVQEKELYCAEICNDLTTIEACKHLDLLNVSWKLNIIFILIKYRLTRVLARL